MKKITDANGIETFLTEDGRVDGWGVVLGEGVEMTEAQIRPFLIEMAKSRPKPKTD